MTDPILESTWQQAVNLALHQIANGEPSPALANCLYYALVFTSQNSARQGMLDDHRHQAQAMLNLAAQLEGDTRQVAIEYFQQVMEHIPLEHRASEYIDLAEITGKAEDIQRAVESIAHMENPYYRALSRLALAAQHPQDGFREAAWADAEKVEDAWGRLDVFVRIARSSADWHERAHQQAPIILQAIDQPYWKVRGIAGVASLLPPEERREMISAAFQLALGIEAPRLRSHALMILFASLDDAAKSIALDQFRHDFASISAEYPLSTLMNTVGGLLPSELKRELLPRLWSMENLWYRLRSLAVLIGELDSTGLNNLRRDMVLYWWSLKTDGLREQVLTLCGHPRLFSVTLLGQEVVETAAQHIIEVCSQWA
jgi:hypothetical protein